MSKYTATLSAKAFIKVGALSLLLLASCRSINPNQMFKTDKDYEYAKDTATVRTGEYMMAPGDRIDMRFYSIEGFRLVDVTNTTNTTGPEGVNYIIEADGLVKLPILGKVKLAGLTLRESEKMLEEKYSTYYVSPFILLRVTNRHVYVFYEDNGHGLLVNLINDNTTIIDAIAAAGGLSENSKAWRIKVLRGDLRDPKIYLIDLSTVEGMKQSNLTVQSNDIIYVEATPHTKQKILAQITPIVGIISGFLLLYNLINQ